MTILIIFTVITVFTGALQEVVEKCCIFRRATGATRLGPDAAAIFSEYATMLASEGRLDVAEQITMEMDEGMSFTSQYNQYNQYNLLTTMYGVHHCVLTFLSWFFFQVGWKQKSCATVCFGRKQIHKVHNQLIL